MQYTINNFIFTVVFFKQWAVCSDTFWWANRCRFNLKSIIQITREQINRGASHFSQTNWARQPAASLISTPADRSESGRCGVEQIWANASRHVFCPRQTTVRSRMQHILISKKQQGAGSLISGGRACGVRSAYSGKMDRADSLSMHHPAANDFSLLAGW